VKLLYTLSFFIFLRIRVECVSLLCHVTCREVIHSSRPVKPRPGVPCVIVRDGPRITQSHQQGAAGVPGRSVMSQMSCPGSVDTANHKVRFSVATFCVL
jgi:hypothetical protein